jgi:periplasmic divalent cation tolerance protein
MDFRFLYITTSKIEEARKIGSALVEARLAACANILSGMESIYWWRGEIVHDREVVLIVKTRAELVDKVIEQVKELHSYACPCVVALPILDGNPAYLSWLEAETGPQQKKVVS